MHLELDRLGFPLLVMPETGISMSLLPVMKIQFEGLIAEPNDFDDEWYSNVLRVNPRLSWRDSETGEMEGLFLTGIWPNDAMAFAEWIGGGFGLMSAEDWRRVNRFLRTVSLEGPIRREDLQELLDGPDGHQAAKAVVRRLLSDRPVSNFSQLTMQEGGVLEWVRTGRDAFGGLGSPRPEFMTHLFDPLTDDPLQPIGTARPRCFGFRLARRLEP